MAYPPCPINCMLTSQSYRYVAKYFLYYYLCKINIGRLQKNKYLALLEYNSMPMIIYTFGRSGNSKKKHSPIVF